MTIRPAQSTPFIAALDRLDQRDHLCSIYESQQEHFAIAVSFRRIGLGRGEKCVYIADDGSVGDVREALQAAGGIDVDRAVTSNSFVSRTNALLAALLPKRAVRDQWSIRAGPFEGLSAPAADSPTGG